VPQGGISEMGEKLKVHQILARELSREDIGVLFGLLGDANLYMTYDFVNECGGTFVRAANENGCVLMALGYAWVTGKVGFATVTHGPAVTNTLTALTQGVKSSTPLVLLCGDTSVSERENLQNINQRDLIVATGAGFEQVRSPETAADDLARAVRRAHAERRPVALNIPADLQHEVTVYEPVRWLHSLSVPQVTPTGEDIENAVGIIASAKRPIVLAGRGAIDDTARAALIRLAERIEAPLATTLVARDLFREVDFNLGVFGTLSTPGASDAILKSDCVIAFGASLNFHTSAEGSFLKGKRVIQVNDQQSDIGRNHVPDVGVIGTIPETVKEMMHWLDEAEIPPSGFRGELSRRGLAKHPQGQSNPSRLDFVHALDQLDEILPDNRILVTDAGRYMIRTMQHMSVSGPRDYVPTAQFGSIGLGVPYAIGASAAVPERPVVLFLGDGGFMLGGLAEFNTAVRHGANLIMVVCNDSSYGAEHVVMRDKQMNPALSLFDWPDIAPLAEALGGAGVIVRSESDFDLVRAAVARPERPLLIELKLDPDHMPFW
jgi:thiamine pyrophosphate-dependent acetolactate synthase large subunit-like protein